MYTYICWKIVSGIFKELMEKYKGKERTVEDSANLVGLQVMYGGGQC